MRMEHCWDDTDGGNPTEKNLAQYHSAHQKSLWTGLGLNPGFRGDTSVNKHLNRGTTPRRWTISRITVKFIILRTVCIIIFVGA